MPPAVSGNVKYEIGTIKDIDSMSFENDNQKKKLVVGDDSVVIGNVTGNVGNGSVVIGPTDSFGNVILNQSMAVGRNAHAGPGSIAIGSGAGATSEIELILNQLNKLIINSNDPVLIDRFTYFCAELNKPNRNKTILTDIWNSIKVAATLDGAIGLITKISTWLALL